MIPIKTQKELILYTFCGLLSIFYLLNIIVIIIQRKTVFKSLIYINCIVMCIMLSLGLFYAANINISPYQVCFLFMWEIFVLAIIIGSSYCIKCLRIIIQFHLGMHYKVELGESSSSSSSSLSSSESIDFEMKKKRKSKQRKKNNFMTRSSSSTLKSIRKRKSKLSLSDGMRQYTLYKEKKDKNYNWVTRFAIRYQSLLTRKNTLLTFIVMVLVGLLIPMTLNLVYTQYRETPWDQCSVRDIGETITLFMILSLYIVIFIFTLYTVWNKRGKGILMTRHLKMIALSWFISILIFAIVASVQSLFDHDSIDYVVIGIGYCLPFIPPFYAEIIDPQIHYYKRQKFLKHYYDLTSSITSIEHLFTIKTSKILELEEEEEEGEKEKQDKKQRLKSIKDGYDCLTNFIFDYQDQEEWSNVALSQKLSFVYTVFKNKKSDKRDIEPGHIFLLWEIFFSKEIGLKKSDTDKLTDKEKSDLIAQKDINQLYRADNAIGELDEEIIYILSRMKINFTTSDDEYRQCSDQFIVLYHRNLELLDTLIMDAFKANTHFKLFIQHIVKNNTS